MKRIGVLVVAVGIVGCTADSRGTSDQKTGVARSSLTTTQRLAWGDGQGQLGFRPGAREAMPMGVPAVAIAQSGAVLVLDALHERVLKTQKGDVVEIAKVPADCDDIAVAQDGGFAVKRSVRPEVIVFTASGEKIGSVDTSAVLDADAISLGTSRRVFVTNGYQQTFLVGSPSMPQTKAQVMANTREGAALLSDGSGVTAVKHGDEVELHVVSQRDVKARWSLGKADAARIVGANDSVACARIEHVTTDASGALNVKREAACLELASGKTIFRRDLPNPGAYMPRRELSFNGNTLVFARANADGLDVTSYPIEQGGVR